MSRSEQATLIEAFSANPLQQTYGSKCILRVEQTRARAPPTWEGGDNTAGVAGDGRDIDNVGATDRPSDVFAAREGPAAIRPVWLALAGEKLFFREKVRNKNSLLLFL